MEMQGEKKRDAGGPNEIVACTNCGGGSAPCTHSANNGCATEVSSFVFFLYIFICHNHHRTRQRKISKKKQKNQLHTIIIS